MMLTTCTWLPPICLAMLPQKFSAATTRITALPGAPAVPVVFADVELQAASKTVAVASSPASRSEAAGLVLRAVRTFGRDMAVLAPVGTKVPTAGL
jgi:hypothetical protein